jgi:predicted enzyme related to lactoylglutathione lyase
LACLDEHRCGVNGRGNGSEDRERNQARARVGSELEELPARRMERHQDRARNEGDERSGERFYPPTDQPGDPEREKTDECLLEARHLVLRCPELNDEPGRDDDGAQLVNDPGAWTMSQLNTRDPEGAKAFYGAVFSWETDTFDMGEGEITLWRLPGYIGGEPEQPVSREVVGVMVPMSGDRSPEDRSAHWSVDFWVEDVDAAADKAAELGGEVEMSPFDTSVGRTAILADPQGAVFSVSKVGPGA